MARKKYDIVVIGGGPGGYVAAIRGAQLGMSVAVVEEKHLGGICLNWGCIPTKAMLKSAEVFSTLTKADHYGIVAENVSFDLQKIINRSKTIAGRLSSGVKHLLDKHKVTIFDGIGAIKDHKVVSVEYANSKEDIQGNKIILATGARPREIEGIESDGELIWNYKHALRPNRIPKKMLIVGSGAIGVEFATFYNSLGSDVTVIEVLDRILPNEDAEIALHAKKEFQNKGIRILESTVIESLEKTDKNLIVKMQIKQKISSDKFDTIIMATGIVGNTEDIGLDIVDVNVKNNHIITNEYCETNVKDIYAIGDVAGGPWLAHKASHEGVLVVEKIFGIKVNPIKQTAIAGCTFCDPQIASVGLTEKQASEKGYSYKVGKFPFLANGKALAIGDEGGFIKTIFDSATGELLGAHLIGPEVTELIHSFVLGQKLEGIDEDFFETIFPHPTLSEAIHESVLNSAGRTIHF